MRPHLTPYFAYGAASSIAAAHIAVGFLLKIRSTGVVFQTADQVAIALLGVVIGGVVLLFARPRLRIGARGLSVRNLLGDKLVPWDQVVDVSFPPRRALGPGGPARRRVHPGDGDPGRRQGPGGRRDGHRARAGGTSTADACRRRPGLIADAARGAAVSVLTWNRARSSDVPARARVHSGRAGRLPVPGPAWPGHLRRQGQEPAQQADVVLRRYLRPAPAHPADGDHRGQGRVDGRQHRGRGAPARVQLDQGVRPAVQRPLPRRQVLSGAGGHAERGVSAAVRLPRAAAQRACATSGRIRMPGPSGRRSTC